MADRGLVDASSVQHSKTVPVGPPDVDVIVVGAGAKALLDLPMAADPGTEFAYNTAATVSLGQAVENSVPLTLDDFGDAVKSFARKLFRRAA